MYITDADFERFKAGIREEMGISGSSAPKAGGEAVKDTKEKDVFDIKLKAVDAKAKIKIIKEVRAITGLGLKEVCQYKLILQSNIVIFLSI